MNILFRVDASHKIGFGHIIRCLSLAQCCKIQGCNVTFITNCESEGINQQLLSEGFGIVPLDSFYPDPNDWKITFKELKACSYDWFVLDGYHFDSKYQYKIKETGCKLLVIDDMAKLEHYPADLILNQNIYAEQLQYSCEPYSRLLSGVSYTLLRSEFLNIDKSLKDIPQVVRKILVTMGGSDPNNVTFKIVQALKMLDIKNIEVIIVLGPANHCKEKIENALSQKPFVYSILSSVKNMPEIMAWADLVISAGGSTCWEILYMSLPCLIIVLAENQRVNAEILEKEGVVLNLGWYENVSESQIVDSLEKIIKDKKLRENMSMRSKAFVDGKGRERIVELMMPKSISFRSVLENDCEIIWKWANDSETRAVSFCSEFIPWDKHIHWFMKRIKDPRCFFYLVINKMGIPIGQLRIEKNEEEFVISVSIDKMFRGRGYGSIVLRRGSEMFFNFFEEEFISAYIKKDNEASKYAFVKAGYKKERETIICGQAAILLKLKRNDKNK